MRDTVFFDLDGTLLPLDMDAFTKAYFHQIGKTGLFEKLSDTQGEQIFGRAVYAMMGNDGRALNRDVFFDVVESASGAGREELIAHMDGFYANEFLRIKACTRSDERVSAVIRTLKDKGYRLVLATNPLFPPAATDTRIRWAGLEPEDFAYVSYYDNSRYCKPDPRYFQEILDHLGIGPQACYIVGNDVVDDMSAVALGFKGFLVLDHVIGDIGKVPPCEQGDYSDLLSFAESLPRI